MFSFWHTVGKVTRRKGYREGRVIVRNHLTADIGGGLCNLSHALHVLVLHSPLTVTEFHSHSDALAPDEGPRVPFSAGTSVCYNYVDFRFRNDTDQTVQLMVWCEGFWRCHRSFLINRDRVRAVHLKEQTVELDNGETCLLSRKAKSEYRAP